MFSPNVGVDVGSREPTHMLAWPAKTRLGPVPVSVAVPPMLAAYGTQRMIPLHMRS